MNQYRAQAEEDDVVCAFGPDYFHGARTGACVGSVVSAALCYYAFRHLKEDQREVDFLAGLRRGQRNPHFSAWTLLRGMRTQPMLTTGCIALATTSLMKCVKCYLANRRCREFFMDDMQFELLHELSETDASAAAFLEKLSQTSPSPTIGAGGGASAGAKSGSSSGRPSSPGLASVPSASAKPAAVSSVDDLLLSHGTRPGSLQSGMAHRPPGFYDGVAVAYLGSVLDCYVPQKPVQRYYNMRAGVW